MLLSRFFSQAITSRTIRYAIPATLGISLLELWTVIGSMPVTIPISKMLALWVLTWPTLAQACLPLCFCLAILITAVQLADTQELAILQLYMQPKDWRRCIARPVMLFFTCMFILTCWLNPMTKGAYLDITSSILQSLQMPTLTPGQFQYMSLTGDVMVIFPDKQNRGLLFVAWSNESMVNNDKRLFNIVQAESMVVDKTPGQAALTFKNAKGYSFKGLYNLDSTMSFKVLRKPLRLPALSGRDLSTMSVRELLRLSSVESHPQYFVAACELIWRLQLPIVVIIIAWISVLLIDYRFCRDRRNSFYATSGTLAILYLITMLIAKRVMDTLQSETSVVLLFASIHVSVVTLSYLLKHSRMLNMVSAHAKSDPSSGQK
ncbi:MAG: hypothetical protein CMF52_07110 [Legionellales bacterium]|nr:hypothetical protein [Legionellales bacterium]